MKNGLLLGLVFLLVGCANKVSKEAIPHLNGYWEIKKVVLPDGTSKEYSISTTVDYIQLEDLQGFRKKVQPKFDGTYDTSNDAEFFTIVEVGENLHILYKNELSEWSETLVELDKNSFSVVNEEGIRYFYQRFNPIKAK